jgi:hypothetical protein
MGEETMSKYVVAGLILTLAGASLVVGQPDGSPEAPAPERPSVAPPSFGPTGPTGLANVRVGQTWTFESKLTIPALGLKKPRSIVERTITYQTEFLILEVGEGVVRYRETEIRAWERENDVKEKTWSLEKEGDKIDLGSLRSVPDAFRPTIEFHDEVMRCGDLDLETVRMVQKIGNLVQETRFASVTGQLAFPGVVEHKSMSANVPSFMKLVGVRQP